MISTYADGQSFILHPSLVLGSVPQALLLAGVLSSDLIHLAERVMNPANRNVNAAGNNGFIFVHLCPPLQYKFVRRHEKCGGTGQEAIGLDTSECSFKRTPN